MGGRQAGGRAGRQEGMGTQAGGGAWKGRRKAVAARRAACRAGPPTKLVGGCCCCHLRGGTMSERAPGKEGGGGAHARSGGAGSAQLVRAACPALPGTPSSVQQQQQQQQRAPATWRQSLHPAQLPCWARWAALHAALCPGQCFFWHSRLRGVGAWAGRGGDQVSTTKGADDGEGRHGSSARAHLQYCAWWQAERLRSAEDSWLQPLHVVRAAPLGKACIAGLMVPPPGGGLRGGGCRPPHPTLYSLRMASSSEGRG